MSCKKTKHKGYIVPDDLLPAFSGLCTTDKRHQIIPIKQCNDTYMIPFEVVEDPNFQEIGNFLWGEESKPITEYLEEAFYYEEE